MSKVSGGVISPRSCEMLDHSAANLKEGLASPPIDLAAFHKADVSPAAKRLRR